LTGLRPQPATLGATEATTRGAKPGRRDCAAPQASPSRFVLGGKGMAHLRSIARSGALLAGLALALGVFGPGQALADQAMHTVRAPFTSQDVSTYPLKDGFVNVTHTNGPVNFEQKLFQLHGALPNTEFFITRKLLFSVGGSVVATATLPSGLSFSTDEHGNGHISTPLAPDDPALVNFKVTLSTVFPPGTVVTMVNQLYDGPTLAYEAEPYVAGFDWKWTP
jgi:hypothetical protein